MKFRTLLACCALLGIASAGLAQQINPTDFAIFPADAGDPLAGQHCATGTGGTAANMATSDGVYTVGFWTDLDAGWAPHAHVFDFDASAVYQGGAINSLRFFCEAYFDGRGSTTAPVTPVTNLDQYEFDAVYTAKAQVFDFVSNAWVDIAPTFLDPNQVPLNGSINWDPDFDYAELWTNPFPSIGNYAGPIDQTLAMPGSIVGPGAIIKVRIYWEGRTPGWDWDFGMTVDYCFVEIVEGANPPAQVFPAALTQDDTASQFAASGGDGVANMAADDDIYNLSYFDNNFQWWGNGPNGPWELGDIFTFDISSTGLTGSQITDLRFWAHAYFGGNQQTVSFQRVSPAAPFTSFTVDEMDELNFLRACVWEVYDNNTGTWDELGPFLVPDKRAVVLNPGEAVAWEAMPYAGQWSQPQPISGPYAGPLELQAGAVFRDEHVSPSGDLKVRLRWIFDNDLPHGGWDSAHFYDEVFVELNQNGGQSSIYWPSWCASTQGFAKLTTSGGVARPGNAGLAIDLTGGVPGSPATLILGLSNTDFVAGLPNTLPFDLTAIGFSGCYLAASMDLQGSILVDGQGNGTLPAPIPASPLFSSGTLYLQAIFIDPLLPPTGPLAFTNGVVLLFQP